VIVFALFAADGFVLPADPVATGLFSLLFVAGLLFVVAGTVGDVTVGSQQVRWHAFSGMGTLAIGLTLSTGLVVSPQLDSAAGQVFIGLLAIANALLFGYMGFDQIRGGQYAELGVP
jgi:hypothetical protein